MKRSLLTCATCAVILTSCHTNEITDSIGVIENSLRFNTAIGKQTRAAELMNNELRSSATETNQIALTAYELTETPDTYKKWFGDNLWYNGTNWQIGSNRYRNPSATKYITFFPKTNVTPLANTFLSADFKSDFPSFTYTIPSVQEDLIAGITDVVSNEVDIVVSMRHILSQINFGVKSYKGAQIAISNIRINNVYSNATYTFGATSGTWGNYDPSTASYSYKAKGAAVPADFKNVESVNTGDIYIFGDGGNYGPGKTDNVWYPVGTGDAWVKGSMVPATGMSNSLMLMPQNLTGKGAFVTFNYTIKDVDGKIIVNNASGQFKLDFTSSNTTAYASEWKQNMRYVYIIDFTDFLNNNKLSFNVDVETYPWENYNGNTTDDGMLGVPVISQPSETIINGITNGETLYIATNTTTAPQNKDVQLLANETWFWNFYTFTQLSTPGDLFKIDFSHVIFNSKIITINVGADYKIYSGIEDDTQTIAVTSDNQLVTIKKK